MSDDNQPDDQVLRQQLFDTYEIEQLTRERINSDKYDSTILTYSTGTLALSLSFIKDVVPLATAHSVWILKTSWVCLVATMLAMLVSFYIGQADNRKSVEFAREYLIEKIETSHNKRGWEAKSLYWTNLFAGAAFFIGILFTTAFVWINVQEHSNMTETKITITGVHTMDGMPSAMLQKIGTPALNKGLPSANMPSVPAPAPPAPSSPPVLAPIFPSK
jgi:hypothetical protein